MALNDPGKRVGPAPCATCGYNGPGYYQPEMHRCAGNPTLNFKRHARVKQEIDLQDVNWYDEDGKLVNIWTLPDDYLQRLERFMTGWGAVALPKELDIRVRRLLPFYYAQVVMEMTRRRLKPLPPHQAAVREVLAADMSANLATDDGMEPIRQLLDFFLPRE